ncbi:MAG: L-threonylcarbamoyladenylate synthase [Candidatus Spechtbacterales bacterium]|nr:L-threonylcarbamoyladenylate synthase [Candidatus Spechtbacterales bacterium]
MTRQKLTKENVSELAEETANVLRRGYSAIIPTDTLYGLAVDALSVDSIAHFFSIKKRPKNKPVPLFVKDIEMAKRLAFIDKRQEEILTELWPGPFTFVLRKKDSVNSTLSAGTEKIGLRIPNHIFIQALLYKLGRPITGSSANISGMDPGGDLDGIIEQFKENSIVPEYIVDAGKIKSGDPSTVIDITSQEPKILRMNMTTLKKLNDIFGKI